MRESRVRMLFAELSELRLLPWASGKAIGALRAGEAHADAP